MIDTLKISRRLENADFSEKQAEELADILREAVEGDLVTKDHLDARVAKTDTRITLDARIAQLEARLIRWIRSGNSVLDATTISELLTDRTGNAFSGGK